MCQCVCVRRQILQNFLFVLSKNGRHESLAYFSEGWPPDVCAHRALVYFNHPRNFNSLLSVSDKPSPQLSPLYSARRGRQCLGFCQLKQIHHPSRKDFDGLMKWRRHEKPEQVQSEKPLWTPNLFQWCSDAAIMHEWRSFLLSEQSGPEMLMRSDASKEFDVHD